MSNFKIGDIVGRKSYGGDLSFKIIDIKNRGGKPVYVLKGLLYRIEADSSEEDLLKKDSRLVYNETHRYLSGVKRQTYRNRSFDSPFFLSRMRSKPGTILHIDSSEDFMNRCLEQYREARIRCVGIVRSESEQPNGVRQLLERYRPDLLVLTGHDGLKKGAENLNTLDSYRNSKYFVQSVKEARIYEPDFDKLFVFAGACQSYYEAIMSAGANFASSPGRILINALDPAIVSEKVATTDSRKIVYPNEVVKLTISGSKGIGGINTKGRLVWL